MTFSALAGETTDLSGQWRFCRDDDKIGVVRNILRRIRRSARKLFTSQHLRNRRIDGFVGACYGNAAVAQQDSSGAHAHAGKADKVSFSKWKCGHCRFVWKLPDHAPPNSSNQSGTRLYAKYAGALYQVKRASEKRHPRHRLTS